MLFPLLLALLVGAPGVTVALAYQRESERCPSQEEFEGLVAARLGRRPFVAAGADKVAQVSLETGAGGRGLQATVRLMEPGGGAPLVRQLNSHTGDCVELASAAALALAIAVNPQAALGPPPDEAGVQAGAGTGAEAADVPVPIAQAPPQGRAPAVPSPATAPEERSPATQRTGAWSPSFGVHGVWGAAPIVSGGLQVGLAYEGPRWGLALLARIDVGGPALGFAPSPWVLPAAATLFPYLAVGRFRIGPTASVGVWRETLGPDTDWVPMVAVGGRAEIHWRPAPSLAWGFYTELAGQLAQARVLVGPTNVWVSPPVSALAGVMLALTPGRTW